MGKPERVPVYIEVPPGYEVTHEHGYPVMRRKHVNRAKMRAAIDRILKKMPQPKKGASVMRTLNKARLRSIER